MNRLKLYLLGPPRLERNGSPLELSRRKAVALWSYLAIERQRQSRDSLAAFFWPDYNQRDARTDLSRTLSYLNRTLGDSWLSADRQSIGLHPEANLWIDVVEFQRLSAQEEMADENDPEKQLALLTSATDRYQGDFMAGFLLPDSPVFDDWRAFQMQSLQQQFGQPESAA
ncbi:hypothetical protein KFU94_65725 [Chloroflexi bacterium TSY]|nr:hypothetical protein [Chloroflexi bacterium TSY]